MTVIVSDSGFSGDDWTDGFVSWDDADLSAATAGIALDVPNTLDVDRLAPLFDRVALIRVPFPSHVDGRGFTVARRLRMLGFTGRVRAVGHVLADQYVMARRCGFDEVEIDDEIAKRQPENQWLQNADWKSRDYQGRLRQSAAVNS